MLHVTKNCVTLIHNLGALSLCDQFDDSHSKEIKVIATRFPVLLVSLIVSFVCLYSIYCSFLDYSVVYSYIYFVYDYVLYIPPQ